MCDKRMYMHKKPKTDSIVKLNHNYNRIFTQTPEAAASSTNKVTKKKPCAQSPPGMLTRSSKLLQVKI